MMSFRKAELMDAQQIRKIRNECRKFFVNSDLIGETQQDLFWRKYVITGKYLMWVICDDLMGHNVIGYTQARNFEGDSCEIGIGLSRSARGKGYGEGAIGSLHYNLLKAGKKKMWLEVLSTNEAGIALFKKSGFKICKDQAKENIIRMERKL